MVRWPATSGPLLGSWRTYRIPLIESAWTVTSGTWDALLADVTELAIDLEFITGPETTGLDNVVLARQPIRPRPGLLVPRRYSLRSSVQDSTCPIASSAESRGMYWFR